MQERILEIFNAPRKSYKDYPNDEKKLEFIYGIYRFFSLLINSYQFKLIF